MNLCKYPGCLNERELYAGEDDFDSLGDFCSFHGETEQGQAAVAALRNDTHESPDLVGSGDNQQA